MSVNWKIFFYYNLLAWVKLVNLAIGVTIFCIPFMFTRLADAWVFLFWIPALMVYEAMDSERKRLRTYLIKGKIKDEQVCL